MGANPQAIFNITRMFLSRNNPIDVAVGNVNAMVQNLMTFNSKMKLVKYKTMLAYQQMQTMESLLQEGFVSTRHRGKRINKTY